PGRRGAAVRERVQGRVRLCRRHPDHGLAPDRPHRREDERAGMKEIARAPAAPAPGHRLGALLPDAALAAGLIVYLLLLVRVESRAGIAVLLAGAVAVLLAGARLGLLARLAARFRERESVYGPIMVLGVLVLAGLLHADHF